MTPRFARGILSRLLPPRVESPCRHAVPASERGYRVTASPPLLEHRPCIVIGPGPCGIRKSFAHRASVARSQARQARAAITDALQRSDTLDPIAAVAILSSPCAGSGSQAQPCESLCVGFARGRLIPRGTRAVATARLFWAPLPLLRNLMQPDATGRRTRFRPRSANRRLAPIE
jgi:hypothetical protein